MQITLTLFLIGSKFIPEGSVRVALTSDGSPGNCQLVTVGFLRPDGASVAVVINRYVHQVGEDVMIHRSAYQINAPSTDLLQSRSI